MINYWQIATFVLIVWNVGNAIGFVLALVKMYRYKAENGKLHLKNGGLIKATADQAERNALTLEAYAELQEQVAFSERERLQLLHRNLELSALQQSLGNDATALREKLEACQAERDSLQGYLDRANAGRLKAQTQLEGVLVARTRVTKPRNSRAKPPEQEGGINESNAENPTH